MLLEKKEDLPEFSSNSSRHLLVIPKISKNAQNWKFLSSAKIIFLNSRAGRSSNFPRQCISAARWRIYQVQCPPPPLVCAGYNSTVAGSSGVGAFIAALSQKIGAVPSSASKNF